MEVCSLPHESGAQGHKPSTTVKHKRVIPAVKHGGGSVMVSAWQALHAASRVPLIGVPNTLGKCAHCLLSKRPFFKGSFSRALN